MVFSDWFNDRSDGAAPRIALIGAGGKTSLMQVLAVMFARQGREVVCTTTTHMYPPNELERSPLCAADVLLREDCSPAECADRVQACFNLTAGGEKQVVLAQSLDPGTHKLRGLAPACLDAVAALLPYAVFLVEADGAAHFPLKAHADHEPCIPACADTLIVMAGLDALGQPWQQAVHRAELGLAQLGLTDETTKRLVSPEDMAALVSRPAASFCNGPNLSGYCLVFLNKLDLLPDDAPVRQVAAALKRHTPQMRCYAGTLRNNTIISI